MLSTLLLIPGEFYAVKGIIQGESRDIQTIEPTMYVHDERIQAASYHVFAGIWEHGTLMRVKVPFNSFNVERALVTCNSPIETRILCFPKEERAPSVQRFVDRAYELIRVKGPHVKTFENDAYEAAGCFGVHKIAQSRLRLIIDYCKRKS